MSFIHKKAFTSIKNFKQTLPIGIMFIITLVSLLFPGYKVLTSDQEIYLPQMLYIQNPILRTHDLLYSFNQIDLTLFDEVIQFVTTILSTNLFVIIFIWTILTRFIYFISIYYIAYFFTKNKIYSLLSPLLFLSGTIIYGTQTLTMEAGLHPRIVALSLSLLFLAFYVHKKMVSSAISLGIALLIHPLTAIPYLAFYYVDIVFFKGSNIFKNLKDYYFQLLIPLLFFIIALQTFTFGDQNLLIQVNDSWQAIIEMRDSYIFVHSWDMLGIVHFISTAVFFIVVISELKDQLTKERYTYFRLLLIIPLILSVLFYIFAEQFHIMVSLQLYRSLVLWKIILPLLFGYYVYNHVTKHPKDYLFNLLSIGIVTAIVVQEYLLFIFLPVYLIMWLARKYKQIDLLQKLNNNFLLLLLLFLLNLGFLFFSTFIDYRKWLEYPIWVYMALIYVLLISIQLFLRKTIIVKIVTNKIFVISFIFVLIVLAFIKTNIEPYIASNKYFVELCSWLENNTQEDSVLVTEPYFNSSPALRFYCARSVFYSYKDGAQVAYDQAYAQEWFRRYSLINNLEHAHSLKKVFNNEDVNFIVSDSFINSRDLTLVFENPEYFVYTIKK